jgi:pyridoxal 5'-phosphate synthase pdxT subunit
VIPGGESTTMLKLLELHGPQRAAARVCREKPVFGTCAGAILLAKEVLNPRRRASALMDLTVERNAYGRQIDSRVAHIEPDAEFQQRAGAGDMEAVFIRAPIIRAPGPGVNGSGTI